MVTKLSYHSFDPVWIPSVENGDDPRTFLLWPIDGSSFLKKKSTQIFNVPFICYLAYWKTPYFQLGRSPLLLKLFASYQLFSIFWANYKFPFIADAVWLEPSPASNGPADADPAVDGSDGAGNALSHATERNSGGWTSARLSGGNRSVHLYRLSFIINIMINCSMSEIIPVK